MTASAPVLLLSGKRARNGPRSTVWYVKVTRHRADLVKAAKQIPGVVIGNGHAKSLEEAVGQALREARDGGADLLGTVTLDNALIDALTTRTRIPE